MLLDTTERRNPLGTHTVAIGLDAFTLHLVGALFLLKLVVGRRFLVLLVLGHQIVHVALLEEKQWGLG